MRQRYQRTREKSKRKFELLGDRELVMRLPLPLVEVWEELQARVEQLAGEAGLRILHGILEDEVTQRVGPPYRPDPASGSVRWGRQPGYVVFGGQKIALDRPRVRTRAGEEVELQSYRRLQQDGRMQRAVAERVVCGLSTRKYRRAVQSVLDGYGIRKSSVSRHFVRASAKQLEALCEKKLGELELVALLIDGIEFAGQTLIVALGVEENGVKHVLGLWQGATENATVCKALLEDLVARGLDPERRYLFVLDGSKALRAAVEKVFGSNSEVQRCQLHKRRNLRDHLPQECQADYDRQLRNAYAMTGYADAKAALEKLFRQLERINPSAARSLEEGMEETLTLHRLGVSALLRRSLASTNIIESCLSTVRHVARNVKRWQTGDHVARWTAAGLLEAEKKFRKVKGYRELKELARKLNPELHSQEQVA
ncbi:MAG: IS256 family transposase [Candidatus Acidiferrales bacterium]